MLVDATVAYRLLPEGYSLINFEFMLIFSLCTENECEGSMAALQVAQRLFTCVPVGDMYCNPGNCSKLINLVN